MCLMSVRIFEHAKTKMKLVNQVFTSFSLLDDVTMTSLYPFRGAMHPLVCSCTVTIPWHVRPWHGRTFDNATIRTVLSAM